MERRSFICTLVIFLLVGFFYTSCDNNWGLAPLSYPASGLVHDEEGQGIAHVMISFSGDFTGSTSTEEDGQWSAVLQGRVTITPSKEGYAFDPVHQEITGEKENVNFSATGRGYLLTVETVEGGSVIPSPHQDNYEEGTLVQLQAIPRFGWSFKEWQGMEPKEENPVTLEIRENTHVTALFQRERLEEEDIQWHSVDLSSGRGHLVLKEYGLQDSACVILFSMDDTGGLHQVGSLSTEQEGASGADPYFITPPPPPQEDTLGWSSPGVLEQEAFENHLWASRREPAAQLSPDPDLGTEADFFLPPQGEGQVAFVLKNKGESYLLWVDTAQDIAASKVWEMGKAFEERINPLLTESFGLGPTAEHYRVLEEAGEKVNILLTPRLDARGYFSPLDLYSSEEYWGSNERKVIYIHYHEVVEETSDSVLAAMAHTLQQMLFYHERVLAHRLVDEGWMKRGLSHLAEDLVGYGYAQDSWKNHVYQFSRAPHTASLFRDSDGGYGLAYLLVRYLYDIYGWDTLLALYSSDKEARITQKNWTDLEFSELFRDFAITLLLHQGKAVKSRYRFDTIRLDPAVIYVSPGSRWKDETMNGWGIHYTVIGPGNGQDLRIQVDGIGEKGDFQMVVVEKRGR